MNRALSWLAAILFLGCLSLGYLAARQKTEITQAKAETTQVNLHWDAAKKEEQKQILDLQQQLAAAKEAQILLQKQGGQQAQELSASAQSKSDDASTDGSTKAGGTIIHISDILKDHPEYAALYAKQMRRNVDLKYGSSLNTLNLAPDQLSKLKDLLTERAMSNIDAQQLATAAGLERGSPDWQAAMKAAAQDTEQQITAILGSNADATLTQLQVRTTIQNQVNTTYMADFTDAGMPLSPAQSSGLIQAMADANYAGKDLSTRPPGYNTPDPTTGLTPHDNRIINAAAQVLNPAQIQVLTTDQVEFHKIAAVMKQYNKSGGPVMFVP
jgi:hypothetical protein